MRNDFAKSGKAYVYGANFLYINKNIAQKCGITQLRLEKGREVVLLLDYYIRLKY